jgi:hypothetical protein
MTKRIRFNTGAVNKLTAMSMKESIRKRLRRLGVKYTECVQLPYEIKLSEQDFVMFCLQWDSELPYQEWRVIEKGPER